MRKYVDDSCVLVYIVLECYKIIIISLKNYKLHASILLTVDTEHFNEIISYTHKRIYVFIHHLSSSILRIPHKKSNLQHQGETEEAKEVN